ncbi:MAG: type II toxin-antitoxin system VapC family toxin [Dongiaceae bacterium]
MAIIPKRVCWDACSWIALIQKEKIQKENGRVENRYGMCRSVIDLAVKGKIELATSAVSLAEVCRHPGVAQASADAIKNFFEQDYILIVPTDQIVGEKARELMMAGYSKLKPPDAIHLATAIETPGILELHSFDERLLEFDGKLQRFNGEMLRICKPSHGGPDTPLFDLSNE